jgi:hypothetical protein
VKRLFETVPGSRFDEIAWANVNPPTLKTIVFGVVIGLVSRYCHYNQ